MNYRILLSIAGLGCLLLVGCSKGPTAGSQHAMVTLRDGSTVSGTVVSSSASQIQIRGDNAVMQTIPMSQVRSVDYLDAATAAAPAPPAPAPPAPAPPATPEPAAITTKTFAVPAGTEISVRTDETIDSGRAVEGQVYAAQVTRDVRDSAGDIVIPRGANGQLVIRSVSRGGHFRGSSDLVLDLGSVSIGGQRYELQTTSVAERGRQGVGANKRTAEFAGGGAAIGSIIGAIAGHGKGAAIGAGAGAGGGALTEILTKGRIKVPAESVLTFRLEQPLSVVASQ